MHQGEKDTVRTSDDEWLADRRKSVGGSEAPVLRGLSSWSTPIKLFNEKRGNAPDSKRNALRLRRGQLFEDDVISELASEIPDAVIESNPMYMESMLRSHLRSAGSPAYPSPTVDTEIHGHRLLVRREDMPWMHATPDAFAKWRGTLWVVEAKTWNTYRKDEWLNGTPPKVEMQVQHAMICCGLERGLSAVLLSFDEPLRWAMHEPMAPDDEQGHISACREFMRQVEDGEEPHARKGDRFERPDGDDSSAPLPDDLIEEEAIFDGLASLKPAVIDALPSKGRKTRVKIAADAMDDIKARRKQVMKDLKVNMLVCPGGDYWKWARNGIRKVYCA